MLLNGRFDTATGTITNRYGLYITNEANNYLSGNLVMGGSVNAAAFTVGSSFVANTTQVTISTIPFSANGSVGTSGQVLASNGATGSPYWKSIPNITVGTSAPGSPAVNDLWVDTN
jgi:hypothetical protein